MNVDQLYLFHGISKNSSLRSDQNKYLCLLVHKFSPVCVIYLFIGLCQLRDILVLIRETDTRLNEGM